MLQDLIPILGIVAVFGSGTVVLIAIIVSNFRQRQLRSAEILAAIDKGIEVPFPPPKVKNYRNYGLIWTSLGIALILAHGQCEKGQPNNEASCVKSGCGGALNGIGVVRPGVALGVFRPTWRRRNVI